MFHCNSLIANQIKKLVHVDLVDVEKFSSLLTNMTQLFWLATKSAFWSWILLHSRNQFHFVEIMETRNDAKLNNYLTTICTMKCKDLHKHSSKMHVFSIKRCTATQSRNVRFVQYCKLSRVRKAKQRNDKSVVQTMPLQGMLSVFLNWTSGVKLDMCFGREQMCEYEY